MRWLAFVVALLVFAGNAAASITLNNFDGLGTTLADQITYFDQNGNAVDAHSPKLLQVGTCPGAGCKIYLYGDAYGCGFLYAASPSTYCGVNVYDYTDPTHPIYLGQPFDPTGATLQTQCDASAGGAAGCFWPRMVPDPAGGYLLWQSNASAAHGFMLFSCATPTDHACVRLTDPVLQRPSPATIIGPGDIFVDGANCYIIYTAIGVTEIGYIEQLDASCRTGTGTTVQVTPTGATFEGPALFKNGSTFYVVDGIGGCAYCNGTAVKFWSSSAVMSGWSGAGTQINANSCGGQPASVSQLTISGSPVYLFISDLYRSGAPNEAMANTFWQQLSFTAGAIDAFTCDATVTIAGLTVNPFPDSRAIDQSSEAGLFTNWCDIGTPRRRFQTIVPAVSTGNLTVWIEAAQGAANTGGGSTPPNGDLHVLLTTVSAGVPGSTLADVAVPAATLAWNLKRTQVVFGVPGVSGTTYGIEFQGANTTGCYATGLNLGSPPAYPAGAESISLNDGVSWSAETNRALSFASQGIPAAYGRMLFH